MTRLLALALLALALLAHSVSLAADTSAAWARIEADGLAGRPLVAHVVVALCDNAHQGIVRVPTALGNGQDASNNLYWGARYGLKTYLQRDGGWKTVPHEGTPPTGVLERLVLAHPIALPTGKRATAYIVADAWDGRRIRDAIGRLLAMAGGHHAKTVRVQAGSHTVTLRAGGGAHVLAYVGHNGLMEFSVPKTPAPHAAAPARSAIVLACVSQRYFQSPLVHAGAHPLVLTTGFMAPEAYTLDAVLKSYLARGSSAAAREAAARAYHRYQKCGLRGARRLFAVP